MRGHRARLEFLDGLRGWAALAVVVFHASWEFFGDAVPAIRTTLLGPINDGQFAVRLFFALSGFVLTRWFVVTGDRLRLTRLAAGRYVRLALPVALISVIGFLAMSLGWLHQTEAGEILRSDWVRGAFAGQAPGVLSFLRFAVYRSMTGLSQEFGYNPFIWTMRYELCGSYVLLAVLALFGDLANHRRAMFAVCFVAAFAIDPLYALFFGGALLAEIDPSSLDRVPEGWRDAGGLGSVALLWMTCAFARKQFDLPLALLLLAAVLLSPRLQRALQTRLSRALGRLSFPLYLVHGYVLYGPSAWVTVALHRAGWSMPAIAGMVVPLSVTVSLLAARLLQPTETLAHWAARRVGLVFAPTVPRRLPTMAEAAMMGGAD